MEIGSDWRCFTGATRRIGSSDGVVGGDCTSSRVGVQARRGASRRRADRVPSFEPSMCCLPGALISLSISLSLTLIPSSASGPISSRHVLYQSLRPPCPREGPYRSPFPRNLLLLWLPRDCARIRSVMPLFTFLPSVRPLCPPTADFSDSGGC